MSQLRFPSRHSLRNNALAIALACPLLLPVAAQAEEDDEGEQGWFVPANTPVKKFYGGLRAGANKNDFPGSNQDGSVTGIRSDDSDAGYGVFVGYQLNDYLAIEGGYRDFGESTFAGTSSGGPSWTAGPVKAIHEADAWEIGMWGRYPIAPQWYAIGYVGWAFWESKETYVEGPFVSFETDNGADTVLAVGLEWDIGMNERVVYRFVGSHHVVDDTGYEIQSLNAEIVYRFP